MSVKVLIGYKDAEDEYHGYLGNLDISEYRLLKKLSEECASPNVLSIDKLKLLSDAKDLIAKTRINLYEIEKEFSETEKQRLKKVNQSLGEALASFDIYRKDAPQLDFLFSFCGIDVSESDSDSDYASGKFWEVPEDEEELEVKRPTKGKKANRDEWIKYLVSDKIIPVWNESFQPFPVYFRRLIKPEEGGVHLEGFGKKTRKRVAEILGIETKEDCERVREEIHSLDESIAVSDIKHIAVSEDFVNTIYDWIECGGRRQMDEQMMSESEIGWVAKYDIDLEDISVATEIEWWRDNIDYIEYATKYNLTTMLFRALRNNILKCERTGKTILSSKDWLKRMEIL